MNYSSYFYPVFFSTLFFPLPVLLLSVLDPVVVLDQERVRKSGDQCPRAHLWLEGFRILHLHRRKWQRPRTKWSVQDFFMYACNLCVQEFILCIAVGPLIKRARIAHLVEHPTEKWRWNTGAGLSPRCGKGFFSRVSFQCRLFYSIPYSPWVQSHALTALPC